LVVTFELSASLPKKYRPLSYMGTDKYSGLMKFHRSISDIGEEKWNALVGTANPFLRYEFLWALENTGCTTSQSGWQPYHLGFYESEVATSSLVALIPLYLKTHSYGEYVFDWSWADAYRNTGLSYYPSLLQPYPSLPVGVQGYSSKAM